MNTAVAIQAQTAPEMKAQVQRIQEVMQAVMKNGTHYGKIPGAGDKPTLFKPGAEVLCATFRIAPSYHTDDLSVDGAIRYRVRCVGTHQTTGIILGEGMGEASTDEEKYKWRAARSAAEFDATPANRKRVKYARDHQIDQIRTEPADQANTVLKMACKRAQVAMTLNVTAASDIFTQDLEDMEPDAGGSDRQERREQRGGKPRTEAPQQRQNTAGKATDKQVKMLYAKLENASIEARVLCEKFGIATVADLPFDKVNDAIDYIVDVANGRG